MIHAFVPRDADGVRVQGHWDALGMWATQSYDTILEDVFVPDDRIVRVLPAGAMAYNPEIQHAVAEMYVDILTAGTLLEATAADWAAGVAHPDWPARILTAKQVAVDAAKRVVDRAQEVAGGAGIATGNELERLYRDARCGWFNGVNGFLTTELIGKGVLGVESQPRW